MSLGSTFGDENSRRLVASGTTREVHIPIGDKWILEVVERLWVDTNEASPTFGTEFWLKESQTPDDFSPRRPVERIIRNEMTGN